MPESALQSVRSETSSVRRPSIPVRKNYPKKTLLTGEKHARNHSYILFVLANILPSGHQHAVRTQNMAQLAINQLPSLQPAIFAS